MKTLPAFSSGWDPVNVREFERHAQLMLSKNAFDYYASGANDMVTLRENRYSTFHALLDSPSRDADVTMPPLVSLV